MPTVLMTGSFEQADPGRATVLRAMRGALPDWKAVAPGEPAGRDWQARAAALRCDATVLTGCVFEPGPGTWRQGPSGAAALAGAVALGRPLALVGISTAPIRGRLRRRLARLAAGRSGLLILRDAASARAMAAAGVPEPFRIGADPAWAALDADGAGATERPRSLRADRVLVVLCGATARLGSHLVAALGPLARAGLAIDLLPWRAGDARERRLADEVAAGIGAGARALAPAPDLHAVRARMDGARLVLGFRHHALAAAASAGVPFVALGHEPGLEALAHQLGQRAVSLAAPPARLTAELRAAAEAATVPGEAVRERIDAARESLRLLRLVLSDGRAARPQEIEGLPLEPAPGL